MKHKQPTSFRLSTDALAKLKQVAEKLGISQASVIEMSIRQIAAKELSK